MSEPGLATGMADDHTKKIIVKNLPDSWTYDYLQNFLETVTPLLIAEKGIAVFKHFTDTALLSLEESLQTIASFQEATQALAAMPFEKRRLTLEALTEAPCSVLVHLTDTVTEDHVSYYFENPKYSGCGDAEVDHCDIKREAQLAIVRFSMPEAVKGVIARGPHQLKKGAEPMMVEPWYEQFHRPLLERLLCQRGPKKSPASSPQQQQAKKPMEHMSREPLWDLKAPQKKDSPFSQSPVKMGQAKFSTPAYPAYPQPTLEMRQTKENERKEFERRQLEEKLKRMAAERTEILQEKERLKHENEHLKTHSEIGYVENVPTIKFPLLKDFENRTTGCKFTLQEQKGQVMLFGSETDREKGRQEVLLRIQGIDEDSIQLSEEAVGVLNTAKGVRNLDNLAKKHHGCSVKLQDKSLLCAALENEHLEAFKEEFKNSLSHWTCTVPSGLVVLPEFQILKARLEVDYWVLLTLPGDDSEDVRVDGGTADVELAATELEKFTKQHRPDKNTFRISGAVQAKAVKEWFNKELEEVKLMITKNHGETKEETNKYGYTLTFKCRQEMYSEVMKKLDVIKNSIVYVPEDLNSTYSDSSDRALIVNGLYSMGVEMFITHLKRELRKKGHTGNCIVDINLPPKCVLPQFKLKGRRDWRRSTDKRTPRPRSLSPETPAPNPLSKMIDRIPFFKQLRRSSSSGRETKGATRDVGGPDRKRPFSARGRDQPISDQRHGASCTVNVGSTKVTVKCGDITDEKVDAAVSVVANNLNIKGTAIGSAFAKKCPSLEQALRAQSGPDGDGCRLITTLVPESDLSMSTLFHAVINEAPREEATKNVKQLVKETLQRAVQGNLKSVAFPPIGVGKKFRYEGYPVACAMMSAIEENLSSNPNCLRAITIVVFDPKTAAKFTEKLKEKLGKEREREKCQSARAVTAESRHAHSSDSGFNSKNAHKGLKDSSTTKFEAILCTTEGQKSKKMIGVIVEELETTFLNEENVCDLEAFQKLGVPKVDEISKLAASSNVLLSLHGKEIRLRGQGEKVAKLNAKIQREMLEHTIQKKMKGAGKREKVGLPVNTDRLPSYWRVCKGNRDMEYDKAIESWKKFGKDRANRVTPEQKTAVEQLVQATWEAGKVAQGRDAAGLQAGYALKVLPTSKANNSAESAVKGDGSLPVTLGRDAKGSSSRICTQGEHGVVVVVSLDTQAVKDSREAAIGQASSVERMATESMLLRQVVKIERLENPKLWQAYSRKREELFESLEDHKGEATSVSCTPLERLEGSKGPVATTAKIDQNSPLTVDIYPQINEHYLFHGTKKDLLHKIFVQGLDFRMTQNAMFGKGVYAAESSTKSDQYTDEKDSRTSGEELKMILMRVLLGQPFVHTSREGKNYPRPPCMSCLQTHCKCKGSPRLFDSVLFEGILFREFIVYDKDVCYPEYIITYKREPLP